MVLARFSRRTKIKQKQERNLTKKNEASQSAIMSFPVVERAINSWKKIIGTDGSASFDELAEKGFDRHPWHNVIALRSVGFLETSGQRGNLSLSLSDDGATFARAKKRETKEEAYLAGIRTLPGYSVFKRKALYDGSPDISSLARSVFSTLNGKISDQRVMENVCRKFLEAWKAERGEEAFLAEEAESMLSGKDGVPGATLNHWRAGSTSDVDASTLFATCQAFDAAKRMMEDFGSAPALPWATLITAASEAEETADVAFRITTKAPFEQHEVEHAISLITIGEQVNEKQAVDLSFACILALRGCPFPGGFISSQSLIKVGDEWSISSSGQEIEPVDGTLVFSNLFSGTLGVHSAFLDENVPSKGLLVTGENGESAIIERVGTKEGVGFSFKILDGRRAERYSIPGGISLEIQPPASFRVEAKDEELFIYSSNGTTSTMRLPSEEGFALANGIYASPDVFEKKSRTQFCACWWLREARRACLGAQSKGMRKLSIFGQEIDLELLEKSLKVSEICHRKRMGRKWREMESSFRARMLAPNNDIRAWHNLIETLDQRFSPENEGTSAASMALIAKSEATNTLKKLETAYDRDMLPWGERRKKFDESISDSFFQKTASIGRLLILEEKKAPKSPLTP